MPHFLIILNLILGNLVFAASENYQFAEVGTDNACFGTDTSLLCIGANKYGQAVKLKGLSNLKQVAIGGHHICTLDDYGVNCFGSNMSNQAEIPFLDQPRMIAAGETHTRAIDNEGLKCWGTNHEGAMTIPSDLKNPKMVSAAEFRTCVLDSNERIQCWGNGFSEDYDNAPTAPLKNTKMISVSKLERCALDEEGAKCWSRDHWNLLSPAIKHPKSVRAGVSFSCVLDDDGVKCPELSFLPALHNPKQISVGWQKLSKYLEKE